MFEHQRLSNDCCPFVRTVKPRFRPKLRLAVEAVYKGGKASDSGLLIAAGFLWASTIVRLSLVERGSRLGAAPMGGAEPGAGGCMAQETKKLEIPKSQPDQAGHVPAGAPMSATPPPLPPPLPQSPAKADKPAAAEPPKPVQAANEPEAASRRVARRRPAGPVRNRIAANDDAPSIGGLIYALEQKPSNKPFTIAWVASGVWAAIGGGFSWVMLSTELGQGATLAEILTRPAAFMIAAAVILPIAVLWLLATLAWRAEKYACGRRR